MSNIGEIERIFNQCIKIANEKHDGHMTLYKFTTNYKFTFGTPNDLYDDNSDYIHFYTGKTAIEAMKKALNGLRGN
jgi:hypothetical protein